MNLEELIAAWKRRIGRVSRGDLVRIRKSVLKNINLPEETKQFLNQGGLIDTVYGGTLTPNLPRLTELVTEIGPLPDSFAHYRVLGDVGWKDFQCLEEGNGQVVVVTTDPERKREVIFENSSIRQYAKCFLVWIDIAEAIEHENTYPPSPTWDEYIGKYEQAIREIDPAALVHENTRLSRKLTRLKAGWTL